MKKLVLCILILSALLATLPVAATAAETSAAHTATYQGNGFLLTSLVRNGSVVGVRFSGYYFGGSGIQVVAEVYSNSQWDLSFYIGDADYAEGTEGCLTPQQTQTKHQLVEFFEQVHQLINQVDGCANTQYDGEIAPQSDIFRFNTATAGTTLEVSQQTYEMLQIAKEMYTQTEGAFNPAVYRLVDLWGFSSRIWSYGNFGLPYDRPVTAEQFYNEGYPLPDNKYIQAFSQSEFVNFDDSAVVLTQQAGKFFVTKNVQPAVVDGVEYQQWLDLGGIAKGYVVDQIKVMLQNKGFDGYYIDSGSSSSAFGNSATQQTNTIVLADPFDPAAAVFPTELLSFSAGKCSVSTSGQYVRKYVTNGVEYAHIIDGTTGAPAQTGAVLVSIVVPEEAGLWAGKGDCLTTALTVMGKDKVVEFVNGYLKQNNITIVMAYQTLDGKQQIISNLSSDQITSTGTNFASYAWALEQNEEGVFVYTEDGSLDISDPNANRTLVIVLGSLTGCAVLAMVVFKLVRRTSTLSKLQNVRTEKPFKVADIVIYGAVVLVIVVLFSAFFGQEKQAFSVVIAEDMETGEQLFYYNVVRKEYIFNANNTNGWQLSVQTDSSQVVVTLSRTIDGQQHFNTFCITTGFSPSVKMTDSLCGFHQDCVVSFGAVTQQGGAIVCSPNRLRLVTQ